MFEISNKLDGYECETGVEIVTVQSIYCKANEMFCNEVFTKAFLKMVVSKSLNVMR